MGKRLYISYFSYFIICFIKTILCCFGVNDDGSTQTDFYPCPAVIACFIVCTVCWYLSQNSSPSLAAKLCVFNFILNAYGALKRLPVLKRWHDDEWQQGWHSARLYKEFVSCSLDGNGGSVLQRWWKVEKQQANSCSLSQPLETVCPHRKLELPLQVKAVSESISLHRHTRVSLSRKTVIGTFKWTLLGVFLIHMNLS